jgi:septal ring factor EnvC (AmiA/AmiB activator)
MLKKLIEALFGVKEETGISRINKVVSHFQDMLDDLATGSAEIKADIADNQDAVVELQAEISDLKADNTVLGGELERAASVQRAISAIVSIDSE